ncbi:MAG TPA: metalloregulator ArsR/SmtB family transcription factor [Steroidobacteraceae bacterium]|nr:metalloregulator ArsR/SmtB family transcription factor [Steroidobacteraceae bacterium]
MDIEVSHRDTLADTASLLSDSSRVTMLLTLLDGRAYTASELARSANISAQTASFHLKRLVSANLLSGVSRGRYRYFRLAGPHVAELLEGLLAVDHVVNPTNPRSTCPPSLQDARACYNHLAGRAGVHLFRGLTRRGWLVFEGSRLIPTAAAADLLAELAIPKRRSSLSGKPCLDWSEREFHIAGELGVMFLNSMLEARWFLRGNGRSLTMTEKGRRRFATYGLYPWTR